MPATVRMGSSGADVVLLQRLLAAAGTYTGPVSGSFDEATHQAGRQWQEMRSLTIDGVVGPKTWASFETEVAPADTAGPNFALSPNFQIREFACKHCQKVKLRHLPELADRLQALRAHYAKPVRINSGYRCPEHNKAIGGVPHSYHVQGMAVDVHVGGSADQVPPGDVAAYARTLGWGGVGRYSNFTHLDLGTRRDFVGDY